MRHDPHRPTPLPLLVPLPPSGKGPDQLLPIPPIGIGRDGRIGRAGHHIERHPMPQGHEPTRLPTRSGRGLPAPGFLPGHDVSECSLACDLRPHPFAPSGDVMARGQEGPSVTGRWVSELGPAQSPRTIGSWGPVGWCDRECPDGAACCRGAAQAICKGCDARDQPARETRSGGDQARHGHSYSAPPVVRGAILLGAGSGPLSRDAAGKQCLNPAKVLAAHRPLPARGEENIRHGRESGKA